MATYTEYFKLQKPSKTEKYSIDVNNTNMDKIDAALHQLDSKNKSQDELLATKESLNSEITRATSKENDIVSELTSEIARAKSAEKLNANNLSDETERALSTEETISVSLQEHISDKTNPHNVTKAQVGLENVDNTSDIDKPVSTAQQNLLDLKANIDSPILTGVPKAPTATEDTNTTQIATTAFAQTIVSNHNTSESSHDDIRNLIFNLTTRLNALADSDDTTLDQLSEIVAYIKNNKSLIDNITTSKVNVSDIIDDLTSTATDKPLSSKQGTILKGLITDLTAIVNDKVDNVSGKGLSTNDYTNDDKNKLDGISAGANVNVQPDWNVTDTTNDSFIKNKPTSMPASDVPAWAKENTKPIYTKEEIGLGNVENKSSETIRKELTKENVISALGYTPLNNTNEFLLINKEILSFGENNICTLTDERITADSLADVYFTSDTISIAIDAEITVDTYDGNVKLSCQNAPTGEVKASIKIKVV